MVTVQRNQWSFLFQWLVHGAGVRGHSYPDPATGTCMRILEGVQ